MVNVLIQRQKTDNSCVHVLMFCTVYSRVLFKGILVDFALLNNTHCFLFFRGRRGHDVLQTDLPPKTEYVILLKLSPNQRQLYMKFLEAIGALSNTTEKTLNPLRAFTVCCKVSKRERIHDENAFSLGNRFGIMLMFCINLCVIAKMVLMLISTWISNRIQIQQIGR